VLAHVSAQQYIPKNDPEVKDSLVQFDIMNKAIDEVVLKICNGDADEVLKMTDENLCKNLCKCIRVIKEASCICCTLLCDV
jgi:hypothetical protein